ncbi:site-specific integrase [Gloeocapsopsis dulcis]|uniref:Tyr recombinase domain-containing protein n=1 Tax=Gloeocapsopsis dulcis AAB1 = 1H9 TaxID=1433147 RepID=A0A6N8FWP3_9CHRO|nr:site-specific integrase [Gloeocapsopsis dulcis]MUL36366.1 hypothetical protein [Gloeocapsopsis dulcis AAB1 = 1H9]WNN88138.1 tyrosine-type recombinase/integrase [Gloeocapsopsis dulcis]
MYSKTPLAKSPKGSVSVESFQGRLRLRLPRQLYSGTQKRIAIGLADTPENRIEAERKARTIELDILTDNFDPTLKKYQPKTHLTVIESVKQKQEPSITELWAKYCEVKKPTCAPGTWKSGYLIMTKHLNRCPVEKSLDQSAAIYDWAIANLTPDTARRLIMYLKSCCTWAVRHTLISHNPFENMEPIKVKKYSNEDRDVNPFTKEERDLIIEGFKSNLYYKHYAPFVKFLFYTGCRPSEAIALQWKHVSNSKILFEQSVVNSVDGLVLKKGLKTQDKREFPIGQQLRLLLEEIRPENGSLESLVFPSPKGGWIDVHNFRNRAWKAVIDSLGIEYRKPYQTRHTFISQQKALGVEDSQIARACGTSINMIHKHYAGIVQQIQFHDM